MTAPRAFVLVQQLHICWGRGLTVEYFIFVSSQPFFMILYSILIYFGAALRIWLNNSTASVRSCTVATYLLGEGIDSRALHLREFSTVFYDLICYSNLFQCRFKDLAQRQHREHLFLYSSYISVGGGD